MRRRNLQRQLANRHILYNWVDGVRHCLSMAQWRLLGPKIHSNRPGFQLQRSAVGNGLPLEESRADGVHGAKLGWHALHCR